MAEIKGFKGLRFTEKAGQIDTLCCPPYDIISEAQRQEYLKENPYNVIRLELPREGENPYEQAGATLHEWLQDGIVAPDDRDTLYIYEELFEVRGERKSVKGFVCRVKIEEFSKNVVLPHEETLSKAKTDRFNLMQATSCNFSQIYSLYIDEKRDTAARLETLSKGAPDVCFTDEGGVTHRLWAVTDPKEISAICGSMADRKLYIADGHHRYETALNYRNHCREQGLSKAGDGTDYVMMMLVDMNHEGLIVFPTHRLVRDLPSFDAAAAMKACEPYFELTEKDNVKNAEEELEALYRAGKKAFGFYTGGGTWTQMVLRDMAPVRALMKGKSEALQALDVSVLHTLVLEKLFGIDKENMANQVNLTYTRVFKEAVDGVDEGSFQCAFILNPTRVSEILDVAAAGEKMPQKSTYFYPKLITGLVMNRFAD